MIPAVIAFFKTPLGRYVSLGVLIVLVLAMFGRCSYDAGREHERKEQAKALAQAEKVVAKKEEQAQKITEKVAEKVAEKQIEYRTVTKTLIKEVPKYVTVEADAECVIPVGFVRLHDTAAAGSPSLSVSSGGSLQAPSGVDLSAVAETVVANYGIAHEWRAEAEGWRAWYAQQSAAWSEPIH